MSGDAGYLTKQQLSQHVAAYALGMNRHKRDRAKAREQEREHTS
jgi:hypothetical protein